MARLLAILTIFASLCACASERLERPEGAFAWAEDGEVYVQGRSLTSILEEAGDDLVEKDLRHRNGFAQGDDGVQGSCGFLLWDDGCEMFPGDKHVWVYPPIIFNTPQSRASSGASWLINDAASEGTGFNLTETGSASSADLSFFEGFIEGEWYMYCDDESQHTATVAGATRSFYVCDRWEAFVADRQTGESANQASDRQIRSGALSAGFAMGLHPSGCGSVMSKSIFAGPLVSSDLLCNQQVDLLSYFRAWYASGSYQYNPWAPSGL